MSTPESPRPRQGLGPQVEGLENLPASGAAIVAFNHVTPVDALLTRLGPGRRIHFAAAPLHRRLSRGQQDAPDLAAALSVLRRGELLGIFPEGARSPDGRLYRGQTHVAQLALEAGVPVLPAAVIPRPGLAGALAPRVVIGEALDLQRFQEPAGAEAAGLPREVVLRTVTDAVVHAILELSGQAYVDVPSGQRRAELGDERRQAQAAAKQAAARRRAEREEAVQRRRADREAEAAEIADAQARAAQAVRDQAVREQVRATRQPPVPPGRTAPPRDIREPRQHRPLDGN